MSSAEEQFVTDVVSDTGQPVVLCALEWCALCWSVSKLFKKLGIDYKSVDLDSVEFQQDDRGRKIRNVLAAQTGMATIPQIYIGGEHVGGCTDMFDAWKEGKAQRLLEKNGVDYARDVQLDPYTLLPEWLHPR